MVKQTERQNSQSTKLDLIHYPNLTERLKHEILELFQPGQNFMSFRQIREQFQVRMPEIRQAISELMKEGFLYYKDGEHLCVTPEIYNPGTQPVGIFISEPIQQSAWGIYRQLVSVIQKNLAPYKIPIIQANLEANFREAYKQSKAVLEQDVAGVIYHCISSEYEYSKNKEIIELFERQKIPVVLLDKYFLNEPENYSYIVSDNEQGGYAITQHLLKRGYQRIAFVRDAFASSVFLREQGFRKALFNAGLRCDERLVKVIHNLREIGTKFDDLFKNPHPPEAVIAINDMLAHELYIYLARLGLRIPQDVAVVGFDDLPNASTLRPALTTVRQDFPQLGKMAVKFLLQRMTRFTQLPHITLPCQLVIRKSCGTSHDLQKDKKSFTIPILSDSSVTAPVEKKKKESRQAGLSTDTIGLVFCGFEQDPYLTYYYDRIIEGIKKQADSCHFQLRHSILFQTLEEQYKALKQLVRSNVKGLIFIATHDKRPPSQAELVFLYRRKIPFIILTHSDISNIPCLTLDDRHGSCLAMEHLILNQKKYIGTIFPVADEMVGAIRLRGCYDAIRKHKFESSRFFVFSEVLKEGFSHFEATYNWAKEINLERYPLDGLICYDDAIALGAIKGFVERNIAIPKQISIIGFDDIGENVNFNIQKRIPLSTIHVPCSEIGVVATRQLIQKIQKKPTPSATLLKPTIVLRQSG